MKMAWLLFLLASRTAFAGDNAYEVVAVSNTHVAVREVYAVAECCGADAVVDCKYPGVAAAAKKLGARSDSGVKLHLIAYRRGVPVQIEKAEKQTFVIYESVTKKSACTRESRAKDTLDAAKAAGAKLGISFGEPLVRSVVHEKSGDCRPASWTAACHHAGEPEHVVLTEAEEDLPIARVLVKTDEATWRELGVVSGGTCNASFERATRYGAHVLLYEFRQRCAMGEFGRTGFVLVH